MDLSETQTYTYNELFSLIIRQTKADFSLAHGLIRKSLREGKIERLGVNAYRIPTAEEEEVELIGRNADTGKNIYYHKQREKYFELDENEERFISTKEGKNYITESAHGHGRFEDWLEINETISVETGEGHDIPLVCEVTSRTRVAKSNKSEIGLTEKQIQKSLDDYFHHYPNFNKVKSGFQPLKTGVEYKLGTGSPMHPKAKVLIEKVGKRRRAYPEEEIDL